MGTAIAGKTTRSPAGTDLFPLSPDGNTSFNLLAYAVENNLAIYNVKQYGAVLDGVTDDSTAGQNAINAAAAAGGGIVYIPVGNLHLIAAGLLIGNTGVCLVGAEGFSIISTPNNSTVTPVSVIGAGATPGNANTYAFSNKVAGLKISTAGTTTATTPAVIVQYAFEPELENLFVLNFGTGISVRGTNNIKAYKCSVDAIGVNSTTAIGYEIDSSTAANASAQFVNCWAVMSGTGTTIRAWYVHSVATTGAPINDLFLTNCEGDGQGAGQNVTGLFIDGTSGPNAGGAGDGGDIHIAHFIADDVKNGIIAQNIQTSLDINGGWIFGQSSSSGTGIALSGTGERGTTVRGVQMAGTFTSAFSLNATTTQFFSISNNSLNLTAATNAFSLTGIAANGVISNNTARGLTASSVTNGFNIGASCVNLRINANILDTGGSITNLFVAAAGLAGITATGNLGFGYSVNTTPTLTSGVAAAQLTEDANFYVTLTGGAAGTYTVTIGPSTGAEFTLYSAVALVATQSEGLTVRVPAFWKIIVTVGGSATIAATSVMTG